jgi:ribosomal protein S18 acetylase RimI-like enzyme
MKRLYVATEHRGRGVGRLLVEEVIRRAERVCRRGMVLDTKPEMAGAIALYREYGFVEPLPYWDHPDNRAIFLARTLGQGDLSAKGGTSDGE